MSKSLNNIINKYYSPKSFDDLDTWLKDLKANANPETKILLIANKLDLEDSRIINKEDGKQIQEDFELDFFTETSVSKVSRYASFSKVRNISLKFELLSSKELPLIFIALPFIRLLIEPSLYLSSIWPYTP